MASRLSSLLVRDGIVTVRRMERAFQRQVIYGGSLDTILLEMNLATEDRLVQYLSLATGIPPAQAQETEVFDAEAVKTCSAEAAEKFRVAPLSFADGTLRVLVHDPVDLSLLEQLADELDVAVQPLVSTEYRFHLTFDRMFGRETDARFARLAENAEAATGATPVGKSKTIIVEGPERKERREAEARDRAASRPERPASQPDHVVVDVPLPPSTKRQHTMEFSTDALKRRRAESDAEALARREQRQAERPEAAPVGIEEDRTERSERPESVPIAVEDDKTERAEQAPVEDREVEAAAATEAAPEPAPREAEAAPEPAPAKIEAPATEAAPAGDDEDAVSPLSVAQAREALEQAESRDLTFNLLLRALRAHSEYAGLLTVQGGAAIGRVAIASGEIDRSGISKVLIPLDADSAFKRTVDSQAPHIGPIATGDAEIDSMIERMGGTVPPSALIMPLVLRNRVVALAIAHRGSDPLNVADVAEVLPLAHVVAEAIQRLILKARSAPRPVAEDSDAARTNKWEAGKPSPAQSSGEAAGDLGGLFDTIESSDDESAGAAMSEALQRPDEAIPLLRERFPGKLSVSRDESASRRLRAAEHGRLLDLAVRLGAAAAGLLVDKMQDPQPDVRYFSVLCASETRPEDAIDALVERLFDADAGVRAAATEALSGYPAPLLEVALDQVRRELRGDDAERVGLAARAATALVDIRSIPDLIDAHDRGQASEEIQQALVTLTRQSFGASTKKWRTWWNKNQKRDRIEWLLDALAHKEGELRKAAAQELRALTGEQFGYAHDQSKKKRDQAKRRWEQWWEKTGRKRFGNAGVAERGRPTAILPQQRRGDPPA